MKTCRPAYATPIALMPEVTWLARRRVLRRAKKSFHVSCFKDDVALAAGVDEAAVVAWRIARARGDGLNEGRCVHCCCAGRLSVLVEKGAAEAEAEAEAQDAMKPDWSRIVKVRACRSALEANMAGVGGREGVNRVVWSDLENCRSWVLAPVTRLAHATP